jgi:hypothetical protein
MITTGWKTWGVGSSIPGRVKIFLFSVERRPALRSAKTNLQLVLSVLSAGQEGLGVKLATHLQLVLRSRMVELYLHFSLCLHGLELKFAC